MSTSSPDFNTIPTSGTGVLFWYRGNCFNVVDGDTVDMTLDLGFRLFWKQRFRLYGIDAYELTSSDPVKRDLANQGKAYVIDKILNKDVFVNTYMDKGDKYGRWLATIMYWDSTVWVNLNSELVTKQLAVVYIP